MKKTRSIKALEELCFKDFTFRRVGILWVWWENKEKTGVKQKF
jgi:hypothetical protein